MPLCLPQTYSPRRTTGSSAQPQNRYSQGGKASLSTKEAYSRYDFTIVQTYSAVIESLTCATSGSVSKLANVSAVLCGPLTRITTYDRPRHSALNHLRYIHIDLKRRRPRFEGALVNRRCMHLADSFRHSMDSELMD